MVLSAGPGRPLFLLPGDETQREGILPYLFRLQIETPGWDKTVGLIDLPRNPMTDGDGLDGHTPKGKFFLGANCYVYTIAQVLNNDFTDAPVRAFTVAHLHLLILLILA